MVGGQAGETVAVPAVGAGIADMQHMRDAAAQDQRGKGAAHAGELGVAAAERIKPAVERADDAGGGALHLHRLGQVAEPVEKAPHRGFRGDPPALGAADAVGDRRHHFLARLGQLGADQRAGEIVVAGARPGARGEADAGLNAVSRGHRRHPLPRN
jgi:hypothetical protein